MAQETNMLFASTAGDKSDWYFTHAMLKVDIQYLRVEKALCKILLSNVTRSNRPGVSINSLATKIDDTPGLFW